MFKEAINYCWLINDYGWNENFKFDFSDETDLETTGGRYLSFLLL